MHEQARHIPNDIRAACLPFSVGLFHACGFIAHPAHYLALHLRLHNQEVSTSIAPGLPTI
jgi:hypothetical protein